MKLHAEIKNGKLHIFDEKALSSLNGRFVLDIVKENEVRTLTQNNALHKFFQLLSDELNEKGLDMRTIIRQEIDLSWTPHNIKEYLWRPLQVALIGKKSTTKLDKTKEINLIYDNLNRALIERTKGEIVFPPFPSLENDIY